MSCSEEQVMAQGCGDPTMQIAIVKMEGMAEDMQEIKSTMKELVAAMQKLAVIEEKQTTLNASIDRAFKDIGRVGDRVTVLEQNQPIQKQSSDFVQTAVKYIIALVLGGILSGFIRVPPATPAQTHPAATGK